MSNSINVDWLQNCKRPCFSFSQEKSVQTAEKQAWNFSLWVFDFFHISFSCRQHIWTWMFLLVNKKQPQNQFYFYGSKNRRMASTGQTVEGANEWLNNTNKMSNCINIDFCHLQTSRTKTLKQLKNKPETLPSEGLSSKFDIHFISCLVCLLLLLLLLWDFLNRATKHRLNEYVYKMWRFCSRSFICWS